MVNEKNSFRNKGIILHTLTSLVLINLLADEIQKANLNKPRDEQIDINEELVSETFIETHAIRPLSDDGVAKKSAESINKFMKNHDDIELAELMANSEGLPFQVVQQIQHLERRRGFPINTIGPSSGYHPETVDWNGALNQIVSWSIAGTIQPIDRRFEDLIRRIVNVPDSPRKLSKEKLLSYKAWGKERIADLCRHIGIPPEDYLPFLKSKLFQGVPDAQEKSDALIRELFHRKPFSDEFMPVSTAYQTLARTIMGMDNPKQRKHVETMLEKPAEYLRTVRKFGLIAERKTQEEATAQN